VGTHVDCDLSFISTNAISYAAKLAILVDPCSIAVMTALISDLARAQSYTIYHVSNKPFCLGSFFAVPGILAAVQGTASTLHITNFDP